MSGPDHHRELESYNDAMREEQDKMVEIPAFDANDLDDVIRELGIEDSDTTPAEAVRELKTELERLRATLAGHAVRLMGPLSPFWRCSYCQAAHTSPLMFEHNPGCLLRHAHG